eukprot:8498278-Pyramimonas_sp.AAC.1
MWCAREQAARHVQPQHIQAEVTPWSKAPLTWRGDTFEDGARGSTHGGGEDLHVAVAETERPHL